MLADVEKLQAGGVDAIMFGNENDRPYVFKGSPASHRRHERIVQAVKPSLKVPFGVNYLWDPVATVAIGSRSPARASCARSSPACSPPTWACGSRNAAERRRLRHDLKRDDMKMLFNINAEFAHSLDQRPIELRAKSAVFSSLADASPGLRPAHRPAGRPVASAQGCRGRSRTCRSSPITGVNIDNIRDIFSVA